MLYLIEIECDTPHLDVGPRVKRQPLAIVAGHVKAIGIMIGKVQDDRNSTSVEMLGETLAGLILEGLRVVAAVGKEGDAQLRAHALDHPEKGLLLNPYLGSVVLLCPEVFFDTLLRLTRLCR